MLICTKFLNFLEHPNLHILHIWKVIIFIPDSKLAIMAKFEKLMKVDDCDFLQVISDMPRVDVGNQMQLLNALIFIVQNNF